MTIPALLLAGLDPVVAIATSKAQSSFGNASACLYFARRGFYRLARRLVPSLSSRRLSGRSARCS